MDIKCTVKSVAIAATEQGQECRAVRLVSHDARVTIEMALSPSEARTFQVGDRCLVRVTEVKG